LKVQLRANFESGAMNTLPARTQTKSQFSGRNRIPVNHQFRYGTMCYATPSTIIRV